LAISCACARACRVSDGTTRANVRPLALSDSYHLVGDPGTARVGCVRSIAVSVGLTWRTSTPFVIPSESADWCGGEISPRYAIVLESLIARRALSYVLLESASTKLILKRPT
jgi:hypothetical protein